jgi:hypothetical protein
VQTYAIVQVRNRPVDPDRAAQHLDLPAVKDLAISDPSLGRVVRFERPKKGECACADRVRVLTGAGHDHVAAYFQANVAVRAEIGGLSSSSGSIQPCLVISISKFELTAR